jgi:hypothetical protein
MDIQENLWYFYIDIVGSSDSKLTISKQLFKVKELNKVISSYLNKKNNPQYHISYTGDGSLITFDDLNATIPFELSIHIHKVMNQRNKDLKDKEKINCRIGIGYGVSTLYANCFENQKVPWGRDLIISRRVMDSANPNQILLTHSAYETVKSNTSLEKYDKNIKYIGSILPKTGKDENVYTFFKKNERGGFEFGNNFVIHPSEERKKRIQLMKLFKKYDLINLQFCIDEHIKENEMQYIKNIEKIINKRSNRGFELDSNSSDSLFKFLFVNANKYISATHLLPSEHWLLHQKDSFYKYQQDMITKYLKENQYNDENYRFIISDKNNLDGDIKEKKPEQFISWHENNKIKLIQIDLDKVNNLKRKHGLMANTSLGLGMWSKKYAIEYGDIYEYKKHYYINQDLLPNNNSLILRKFLLYDNNSPEYTNISSFFEELKFLENSSIIDMEYYNTINN